MLSTFNLCFLLWTCLFLLMSSACNTSQTIESAADIIYHNGAIITMEEDLPNVEAVAVKDGEIYQIGTFEAIQKLKGDSTKMKDLEGRTMLPGFIDAHSHFSIAMKMIYQAHLASPPAGDVAQISDIIQKLKNQKEQFKIPEGNWILGWGYDPDQLVEKRHPTKDDLDEAFPEHPVFILHVSAHMAVVNSKALEIIGIDANTLDPEGGLIVRISGSLEPAGLLQEKAVHMAIAKLPVATEEQLLFLMKETSSFYAARGITTAQDGLTDLPTYQLLKKGAAQQLLQIDLEALASFQNMKDWLGDYAEEFGKQENRLRLAGIKIVADGSPQGKTAFFKEPYLTEVPGCVHECRGIPTVTQDQLDQYLKDIYSKNIQAYVHANGDGSIDMLLDAHEQAIVQFDNKSSDLRTVVIHSQFVRPDQLEEYKNYGFVPAFFTNHAFYWGDVHIENLGMERASFLSPMKTAMNMGIMCTNHTDYIVTPLNQLFLLWTAVTRKTRSGKTLGAGERLTVWEGLKAITINSAYQHKLEMIKGSIKKGKLADFVILDRNPMDVELDEIKDIEVVETIKEGVSVFEKE